MHTLRKLLKQEQECQVLPFHYQPMHAAHMSAAMENKRDDILYTALIKPIQGLIILDDLKCFS